MDSRKGSTVLWGLVLWLVLLLGLVPAGPARAGGETAIWQAGEAAVEDARQQGRVGPGRQVFLGGVATFPGVLRLELLTLPDDRPGPGRPFAVYEFDTAGGRVLRRDFLDQARVATFPEGRVAIHGVLRNLPGYILDTPGFAGGFVIWAEAQGRVVATDTELQGTTAWLLKGVPSTAGTVVIKAKIRGYDLLTLHPGLVINPAQPGGTIGGIDVDFHQMSPISRDVRLVVQSSAPAGGAGMSFPNGARARVTCQQTGASVDVVSANGMAEAYLSDIPTGWNMQFLAVNLDQGYHWGQLGPKIIPEDGGSAYTDLIQMK
ncbi:MAG: hypothetical protein GX442_01665 [Candidatus Riflebacteria bacterium]|nr:hypothetical protein [Candidatus Riflebacteria bacterium]